MDSTNAAVSACSRRSWVNEGVDQGVDVGNAGTGKARCCSGGDIARCRPDLDQWLRYGSSSGEGQYTAHQEREQRRASHRALGPAHHLIYLFQPGSNSDYNNRARHRDVEQQPPHRLTPAAGNPPAAGQRGPHFGPVGMILNWRQGARGEITVGPNPAIPVDDGDAMPGLGAEAPDGCRPGR
jgi:hypothetical protein